MGDAQERGKIVYMVEQEVRLLVEEQIGNNWDQSNAHGVNLQACLVTPEKRTYQQVNGQPVTLWLVLEEDPEERKGYKIVFSEEIGRFGLATTQINGPEIFLGFYGSFLKTLEAM